jgi:hypothetical protein
MNTSIHKRRFGGINFDVTMCAACHRLWFRTQLSSFPPVVALLIFVACLSTGSIYAQACHPAAVNYIVRDDRGRVLGESELNVVYERMSKLPGEVGVVYVGTAFMAKDRKTFYSPYSEERKSGEEVPLIAFEHDGPCQLKLADATLEYQGKKMRLIFDVDIPSKEQPVHDLVIDSLPFQEGTFKLDLSGLEQDDHRVMAATRWKRVSGKSKE